MQCVETGFDVVHTYVQTYMRAYRFWVAWQVGLLEGIGRRLGRQRVVACVWARQGRVPSGEPAHFIIVATVFPYWKNWQW